MGGLLASQTPRVYFVQLLCKFLCKYFCKYICVKTKGCILSFFVWIAYLSKCVYELNFSIICWSSVTYSSQFKSRWFNTISKMINGQNFTWKEKYDHNQTKTRAKIERSKYTWNSIEILCFDMVIICYRKMPNKWFWYWKQLLKILNMLFY